MFMDMERVKMEKPLIQIDDLVREMTDDEHAEYLLMQESHEPQEL